MNYFHHQFQQAQPIQQTGFGNNNFFQDHDPRFPQSQNMGQFPVHGRGWVDPFATRTLLQSHRTETKPRLSKGEVARLEAVFQANNKPSSSVKKDIANDMRVDVARINVRITRGPSPRTHKSHLTDNFLFASQNWFQNRRAKKKQELKTKELEANAEAEKDKDKRDASEASDANENVSPDQDDAAIKTEPSSPAVCDNTLSTGDNGQSPAGSNLPESYHRDGQAQHASPEGLPAGYECGPFEFTPADDTAYFAPNSGNDFTGMVAASNACLDPALATAQMGYSMQGSADGLEAFSYEALMFPGPSDGVGSFETPVGGFGDEHFTGYQTEGVQASIEPSYQKASPETTDNPNPLTTQPFRLQSPPAIDLAGRRKRPGLALSGIRSTSNGPATGMDFGRRALDPGSPMRRVTSATGFGPQGIRRFHSQQRGGMFDRRQGSLLHAVRSPNPAPFSSMAPPTPDTPVVATHQSVREATVSSSSSEEEGSLQLYQPTGLASQPSALDQSIRTPPATPIGLGDVFANSIGASLGYPTAEESFAAQGMDAFSMRSGEFSVPSYVADGYVSQPATPQLPMATGYYSPVPTNSTEYNWTGAAMVSTKSSPNPHQMRPLQFSNVTPQDFGVSK